MNAAFESHGRLGFIDLALRAFSFLFDAGFRLARREEAFVRFESSEVFVNVYHGRSSYQVGLELGRAEQGDVYSLHELLTAMAPEEVGLARCQTSDPVVLSRCLIDLARVLQHHFRLLLAGDLTSFDRLRAAVGPLRAAATLEAQYGATRSRADQAWEARNMPLAETLYEEAEPALGEAQRRRLSYLRNKAQPTNRGAD